MPIVRVVSLREQKAQQIADLTNIQDSRVHLQHSAEALAEKYDDISYKMEEAVSR